MNAEWTREDSISIQASDDDRPGEGWNDGPSPDWGWVLGGLGIGAAAMYLFDPTQGRRRRAYLNDQVSEALHGLGGGLETTARDMRNRALGVAAETAGRMRREEVPDDLLVQRVRSALGRAASHPRAIQVTANHGCVTLAGAILAREEANLMAAVSRVRGVRQVENRLARHAGPGNRPEFQGGRPRRARAGLARENWDPTTRFLAGAAGGALAAYGSTRRDAPGTLLGILGAGLFLRAVTNMPVDQLTGIGAGREGVELRKTLNIAASPGEVFAFCALWENFPQFMSHVRTVTGEGQQSHWVVDGPAGVPVSWDALVTDFVPNRRLAWKSVAGAAIQQAGLLQVDPNPDGTTRLDIRISYNPPAGALGHAVAALLGANPERQMDEDFNRLKSLIEAGKTATPERGEASEALEEISRPAAPAR